jgi:hypothetical protein
MRKGPVDRMTQQNDQFDAGVIGSDSLDRWPPVSVNRSARAGDERSWFELYAFVQNVVFDFAREAIFIVEEVTARMIDHMRLLAMSHRDVWMLLKMIVQRARPTFLGPSYNEIQSIYFRPSRAKHGIPRLRNDEPPPSG